MAMACSKSRLLVSLNGRLLGVMSDNEVVSNDWFQRMREIDMDDELQNGHKLAIRVGVEGDVYGLTQGIGPAPVGRARVNASDSDASCIHTSTAALPFSLSLFL